MLHKPPLNKKTVTFAKDTKDPQVAEQCSCCSHRNIIPRIREMDLCMECFKQTCSECLTSMGICIECEHNLLGTNPPKTSPDSGDIKYPNNIQEIEEYPELSDDSDGDTDDFMAMAMAMTMFY